MPPPRTLLAIPAAPGRFLTAYQAVGVAPGPPTGRYNGTMSGAPSRAASAVRSSGWRCDSRSASTRFS